MGSLNIGLQLTVFGMGLVFLLLAVMALLIMLLLRLDRTVTVVPEPSAPEQTGGFEPEALAAISIAVTMHQALRRKEAVPVMREYQPGTLPSRWLDIGRTLQNTRWQPDRRTK